MQERFLRSLDEVTVTLHRLQDWAVRVRVIAARQGRPWHEASKLIAQGLDLFDCRMNSQIGGRGGRLEGCSGRYAWREGRVVSCALHHRLH